MRPLLFAALLLASAGPASAKPRAIAPELSLWAHVQALPLGTYLHIDARTRHSICTLKAIDPDSLTCTHDTGVGTRDLLFQRPEITSIKLARRGRSAVLGASIGAGVGAIAGGIEGARSNYFAVKGAFAMIYAFSGAFLGAPAGYLTDFSGSTIYRAN